MRITSSRIHIISFENLQDKKSFNDKRLFNEKKLFDDKKIITQDLQSQKQEKNHSCR
jgi:hypothetical protein